MPSIDDYQITKTLYESNRTLIHRAQNRSTLKNVILKGLNIKSPATYEINAFNNEYEILKKLENLNGTPSSCFKNSIPNHIIVMDDINGVSLKEFIRTQPFHIENILSIAIDIAVIIGDIHAAQIIHKDINPANIIFDTKNKRINIIDFGISTQLSIENPILQSPNVLEGSLHYISPEQTGRMNRSLDYRTDYYSFGVTLYELLTQTIPFKTKDPMELIHCHIAKHPVQPHTINKAIPIPLSNIVMKLVSKNAEDRYQSSIGIISDLKECKDQYQRTKTITEFSLGKRDIPERFQIPQKLYGRENEVNTLLSTFDRIFLRTTEMILISGYSGIGKTVLVKEIYKPITRQRGYFISGKFDQFQRDIPYKAIVEAFSDLARQLLTEKEDILNHWKNEMISALGPNGQVLIDIIPDMELVIGKQPEVVDLGPAESQNRFYHVFQSFINTFTHNDYPLIIFLDDLQWADMASIKLIQLLMKTKKQSLFIIGAYRDNEVHNAHPLIQFINEIKKTDSNLHEIFLCPLNYDHVSQLICDSFYCNKEKADSLTNLVLNKTGGNPFFINEFLKTLYVEGLILFNRSAKKNNSDTFLWQWDVEKIKEMKITDNVVDLMTLKIKNLGKETQRILNFAACIGNSFDLNTLTIVSKKTEKQILNDLNEALSVGLIITKTNTNKKYSNLNRTFKFSHDRIQQAAYSLINEKDRKKLHYKIGRLIFEKSKTTELGDEIFDIVNHLNLGLEYIKSQFEKNDLANLNLIAGKKAKASSAYETAFRYLNTGLNLLHEKCWEQQYELTFSLYIAATEAACLIGKFEEVERFSVIVLNNATTTLDKVKMHEVKILAYNAQNKGRESVRVALEALKILGINFPAKPNKIHIIWELLKTKIAFREKKFEDLENLPEIDDQDKLAAIRILDMVSFSAYSSALEFYPLLTCTRVKLCAKYGNSMWSSGAYSAYGLLIVSVLGEFEKGYQFGKLAFKLMDKYNENKNISQTLTRYYGFIWHWKKNVNKAIDSLQKASHVGIDNGEFDWAGVSINGVIGYSFISGKNLSEIRRKSIDYTNTLKRLSHKPSIIKHNIYIQTITNIIDDIKKQYELSGDFFDEKKVLPELMKINESLCISQVFICKLFLYCIFNITIECKKNSDMTIRYMDGSRGTFFIPTAHFCNSLLYLSLYNNEKSIKQKRLIIKQVKKHLKKLKNYSHHAPMNHLHKYCLVKAELYRVQGKILKAKEFYDKAIELAKKNEYTHEEAMAAERAALFWIQLGNKDIASSYMNRAYDRFKHWGANNKLRDLETKYPDLLYPILKKQKRISDQRLNDFNVNSLISHQVLDLSTVFKTSQIISNEIDLKKLIQKLLNILVENSRAEKGFLILNEDDSYTVVSQIMIAQEEEKKQVRQINDRIPLEQCNDLSEDIVLFSARSLQNLVLDNAAANGAFINDPYVKQQKSKSILCSPIIYHSELTGLIYLENNKTIGAFTPERVETLSMISSQAAISIENAKLYGNLKETAEIIKTAEEKYRGIFNNAIEGIFQSTPEGKFLDVNPSMTKIFGFETPKEMISQVSNVATQCYANPEDRNRFIEELLIKGKVIGMEGEFLRKDNSKGTGVISARAVYDVNGNIQYYEGTLTDVTERKEKMQAERTREIAEASKEKIMDSIRYAQMIQQSLLPDMKQITNFISNSFILYQPKDIVGGDIYFSDLSQNYFIIAVIDCTGHGVPGAFMTMIACSSLRRIVADEKCYNPAQILTKLNFAVKSTLQQNTDKSYSDDGMDISVCAINKTKTELTFAGAVLPLIYIKDNELFMIKGNRQSIGYKESKRSRLNFVFKNHNIPITKGMCFYMATDGFQDQLGGESISCFGKKRFKNLLKEISVLPLNEQKNKLFNIFHDYRGENEVQDDLTVVGFKI